MAKSPRKAAATDSKKSGKNQNPKVNLPTPQRMKGGKNIKKLIKKRSRRFSLVSDSESERFEDEDDDDDDEDEDEEDNGMSDMDEDMNNFGTAMDTISSSDDDDDDDDDDNQSDSDDYIDKDFYKNRKFAQKLKRSDSLAISSGSEDNNSSSSDDENVNLVQLTKERRAKAMKAAKALKTPRKSTTKQQQQQQQPGRSSTQSPTSKQEIVLLDDDDEDDEDDVVPTKVAEPAKDIDFLFDFDNEGNETFHVGDKAEIAQKNKKKTQQNKQQQYMQVESLSDEDIGEVVELDSVPKKPTKILNEKTVLDVPKIDSNDIDSDADYEFDKNDLIQALQDDNDDLELGAFGNSEDDYDFLLPDDDPFYKEGDDNYLLKQETDALVDDYQDYSSSANVTPRHSIVAIESMSQLPGEAPSTKRDDKQDQPASIATTNTNRQVSSTNTINNGKYYDEDDYDDDEDEESDFDISVYDEMFENNSYPASLVSPGQGGNEYVFESTDDEEDDTHLIPYFFSSDDSESENDNEKLENIEELSGDETDEDTSIPAKSSKPIGSKLAKEVLSSSKNNFRAPVLGTFNTLKNKKPYSIIDGYSTRFLKPLQIANSRMSVIKGSLPVIKSNRLQSISLAPVANNTSSPAMDLDELLNISEFEEDEDNTIPPNFDWGFHDRRVPLSAFRNKGVINNYYNHYDIAKRPSILDNSTLNKRSSKTSKRRKNKQKKELFNLGSEVIIAPVRSIKVKPSKIKKVNKTRMRRQSVAEAHAEGLRTTKSGLFSEETLADVEAFLVDIGSNDDLSFLYSEV